MKRLFKVVDINGKIVLAGPTDDGYWELKAEAKKFRDYLNRESSSNAYTVSRGPDHIGPHGNTMSRNRLQPKKVASYSGL